MGFRIQINSNDEASVGFINEKPVIGTVSAEKTLSTLFTLSDIENLVGFQHFCMLTIYMSPDSRPEIPLTVTPENTANAVFCYIPYLIGFNLTQVVLQWINISGNTVTFQAFELSPDGSTSDVTQQYESLQARFVIVDSTNIEFKYEEE